MGQGIDDAAIDCKKWVELVSRIDPFSFGKKGEPDRVTLEIKRTFLCQYFQLFESIG